MIRLNIGSGHIAFHGYVNVDIANHRYVDLKCDARNMKDCFEDNSVDEIFAKDILEHLSRHITGDKMEWQRALQDWVDILKPGGVLKLQVPDIILLIKDYQERTESYQGFQNCMTYVFGIQNYPTNTHKTGFSEKYIQQDMENAGLIVLEKWIISNANIRITAVKGNYKPLVELEHPDFVKELRIK